MKALELLLDLFNLFVRRCRLYLHSILKLGDLLCVLFDSFLDSTGLHLEDRFDRVLHTSTTLFLAPR